MSAIAEARTLMATWKNAYAQMERRGTLADHAAEQDAYDTLVDFVEANDLVDTEVDPR